VDNQEEATGIGSACFIGHIVKVVETVINRYEIIMLTLDSN